MQVQLHVGRQRSQQGDTPDLPWLALHKGR
jgi:hypothetical protein